MTIVTSRHRRKRAAKPAQAAAIKVARIVQQTPRGRAWKLPPPDLPPDPEAEASVADLLARMTRPVG